MAKVILSKKNIHTSSAVAYILGSFGYVYRFNRDATQVISQATLNNLRPQLKKLGYIKNGKTNYDKLIDDFVDTIFEVIHTEKHKAIDMKFKLEKEIEKVDRDIKVLKGDTDFIKNRKRQFMELKRELTEIKKAYEKLFDLKVEIVKDFETKDALEDCLATFMEHNLMTKAGLGLKDIFMMIFEDIKHNKLRRSFLGDYNTTTEATKGLKRIVKYYEFKDDNGLFL